MNDKILELLEVIDKCNFECEAGFLKDFIAYTDLKQELTKKEVTK